MQCLAWDKRITEANSPQIYEKSKPLSPFNLQPMPLYVLKYKGLVQTSCVPDNAEIPLLKTDLKADLLLKVTSTGVTFLGVYNQETEKYEPTGRFRKRYLGSKTCGVCINGRLWLNAAELKNDEKKPKYISKKNTPRVPPGGVELFTRTFEQGAISEEMTNQQNLSPESGEIEKKSSGKDRKKSYKVDKGKVRQRILGYINTMKGKKNLFFWTVSFPEHTPDDVCYKAFNTWLTALRQRGMLKEYLWVAERQTGERLKIKKAPTHTIHFHIAIPHYMNVHHANGMMRETLKGLAKKGLLPGLICDAKTRKGYYLPSIAKYNGVDISKHRTTRKPINFEIKKGARSLAHYLTKYVTKNDAGQTNDAGELIAPGFTHLAWHNSRGFSALFTAIAFTLEEFTKAGFGPWLNRVRTFSMKFATFVPWLYGPPPWVTDHFYKLNSFIQQLNDEQSTISPGS